jgi:sugar O-acyltransferase (sialic acid O-acetyltransferase NeuD family)
MRSLIILGAGGSGHDIIGIVNSINKLKLEFEILGFLDDNPNLLQASFLGYKVIGSIDEAYKYDKAVFISSIANPSNRTVRRQIFERVIQQGCSFCNIIHPNSVFYDNFQIGTGVVINANCVFGSNVIIEDNVHFGYSCNIAHESIIGKHSALGSAVNLSSSTIIGHDCYIGCGVSSAHDVTVCDNTLVAAGSAIVENILDNTDTWIGVPVIKLRTLVKNRFKLTNLNLKNIYHKNKTGSCNER